MKNLEIITLDKPNVSNFAAERNILLKNSKSDWVLFLDSDEIISKDFEKEIYDLDPKDNNGFVIKRKIIFLGKEIGEDRVLRLGKKGTGKWQRAVHETWQIRGKVGELEGYIIHNTAGNLNGYIKKLNNYSTIHARENLKEGKNSNLVKIIFFPKMKFLQNIYFGRGFVFSMLQSFHSFLGWVKIWELQKK
jgi:hypothetical protein